MEILNVAGSREQISDLGFARYVEIASPEAKSKLRQLDISRCMLSQRVLVIMQALTGTATWKKSVILYIIFIEIKNSFQTFNVFWANSVDYNFR